MAGPSRKMLISLPFILPLLLYSYAYFRLPLLPMIDGPYYSAQLLYLAERGALRHPDPPLTFLALLPFYVLLGDNILAVKVGVPILCSLIYFPAFFALKEMDGDDLAAVLGALTLTLSRYTVRMVTDFVKNALGLMWVFTWLFFASRYLKGGRSSDLALAALSSFLALLTHILDFGFVVGTSLILAIIGRERKSISLAALNLALLVLIFLQPWIVGGDVFKGVAFVEEVSEGTAEQAPLLDLIPYAASLLLLGLATVNRSSVQASVALLSLLMNLPLYGRKWLMRFSNMNGISLSLFVSAAQGFAGKRGLALSLFILTITAVSGLSLASSLRSTIDPATFEELRHILSTYHGSVFVPDVKLRYWAETISIDITTDPRSADYMLICRVAWARGPGSPQGPAFPQVPPRYRDFLRDGGRIIYRGDNCVLHRLRG